MGTIARSAGVLTAVVALTIMVGTAPAQARPAVAAQTRRPIVTPVAGGVVTVPTGAPTSGDPSKFEFNALSTEEWTGDWTGVSVAKVTDAHVDVATGSVTGTILDTFTGVYAGDHSSGTLVLEETFDGNVFTGAGVVEGHIVGSSGDPTFQCSTGTVTMPVYVNAVFGYGGYSGTWHHGCPGAAGETAHSDGPARPAAAQPSGSAVAGGIVTVPTGAPTSADPQKFDFKGLCTEEWMGDWTGVSVCNVTKAHVDIATGRLTATIVDTFTGTYMSDHSTGTLVLDETFDGNFYTGSGVLMGRIAGSSGDPTFQCSTGSLVMPFYFNAATGYGGYTGMWHHGCGRGNAHA